MQKTTPELQVSLSSNTLRLGEAITITAWLTINGEITRGGASVRYLLVSAHVRQPDGTDYSKALFDNGLDGDNKKNDGIFTCRFTPSSEGEFTVNVLAEGKGFRQKAEKNFIVRASADIKKMHSQADQPQDMNTAKTVQKPAAREFPWVTFIAVNIAALACWTCLFILAYKKIKRRPVTKIQLEPAAFSEMIRRKAEEALKTAAEEKGNASTSDAIVINDIHSARQIFLKAVSQHKANNTDDLWNSIFSAFDTALKSVLKSKKTALDEIDNLQEKVEEIGILSEELKEVQALADTQAKKISFLMGFKDVIAESKQRVDALSKRNRELENSLFEAVHAAGDGIGDNMKGTIEELKENYRQLELCISTLETENERLVEELIKWKKDIQKEPADNQAIKEGRTADDVTEIQTLRNTISDLESSLKTKEKELSDLKKSFESLEAEYMVLYQEKQSPQQQPEPDA